MKWSSFYDNCYDWEEKKLIHCIGLLENFGPIDEIIDAVNFISSENACNMLIQKAMRKGVKFSMNDIKEVIDCIDAVVAEQMISAVIEKGIVLTTEDIDDIEAYVGDGFLNRIIMKRFDNPGYTPKDILDYANYLSEKEMKNLVLKCKVEFTEKDLYELGRYLDPDFMESLYRKYGLYTEIEDISYDDEGYFELADKKGGIVKRFYNYLFIRDTVHKLHKLLKFPF